LLDCPNDSDFDYTALQRIEDALGQLLRSSAQKLYSGIQKAELDKIGDRLQRSHQLRTEVEDSVHSVAETLNEKREADIKRLLDEQAEELSALVESWSQELPPKYRRVSPSLVNIRNQERQLRLLHRFNEAKAKKRLGDALEASEMEENREVWRKDCEVSKEMMIQKHRQQMKCLMERWDREWTVLDGSVKMHEKRVRVMVETTERRLTEVQGSRNDFRLNTTRSVQRGKREWLPIITGRHTPRAIPEQRSALRVTCVQGAPRRLTAA
jgi:hypothetical protein